MKSGATVAQAFALDQKRLGTSLAAPVQTEAAPMPAHQRLRLEDNRGFEQGGEQPIEPDEDQAICSAQPEPRRRGPLQDNKLLAEKCHLGFASRTRSE